MVVSTIVIAIATVVYAVVTIRLWNATKQSADAAKANAEAFVNAERAWIMVDTGEIRDDFEPDLKKAEFMDICPVVRNAGRTPGRITGGFICSHKVSEGSILLPKPNYEGAKANNGVNIVLAPNAAVQPLHVMVALTDFAQARQRKIKLYVYGFVDYVDLAGKDRYSRFCLLYHIPHGFDSQARGFYHAIDVPTAYTECT